MGISRIRISFGAVAIAVLLAVQASAEDTSSDAAVAAEPVAAQTVSTAPPAKATLPAEKSVQLFRHTSYPKAWTAAQQSNRPILLYVTMSGCPHCDKMMKETLHLPNVEQMISESFEVSSADVWTASKTAIATAPQLIRMRYIPISFYLLLSAARTAASC
jgi:thioredoxin-related protein